MASKPTRGRRISVGPRLCLVGARYYIRVRIPRDLQDTYRAEGKRTSEIFEPLSTVDRRDAERRCRARGSEIDVEFDLRRKRAARDSTALPPAVLDDIANRVYRDELAAYEKGLFAGRSQPSFSPDDWVFGHEGDKEEWMDGLVNHAWTSEVSETVDAVLRKEGFTLPRSSPAFSDARLKVARAVVAALETARARAKGDYGFLSPDPVASHTAVPQGSEGHTVAVLVKNYTDDKGAAWSGKTRDGYTLVFRALKELLGEDKPIKEITPDDCRRVRDTLYDLAPNYTKLAATKGKPMDEAAKISRTLDMPRRQPATVNSYLNNLAALFNFAVEKWYVDRSPAKGLQLPVTVKKKDKKQPFDSDQLKAIFIAPLYTGCRNDGAGYATIGTRVVRRGRFWVPLLSLWTGMRLNECCQLHVADVTYLDNVPVIVIREDDDAGIDDKRVKTDAGERYVPVHPELVKIGFLTYWTTLRDAGETRLFPDLPKGTNGYYSDPFQKWFGRFLDHAKARKAKTSFHSFRHSYRDALREAEIPVERVKALGGWANVETQEDYGGGFKPATLYQEIKKVGYPGLDLSHLYEQGA